VAVLLLTIVAMSYLVVSIAALGLELTGIEAERASFQALSAFTNSGFTTRESEEMLKHPIRRRIIAILMITGNAGTVTMIGTFASSLVIGNFWRTLIVVASVGAALLLVIRIFKWTGLAKRLHDVAQAWLARHYDFHAPTTEELLRVGQGYGLTRIALHEHSPVCGRYLRDLDLKQRLVTILAIERGGRFIPVPMGDAKLQAGDMLIVYGTESNVHRVFHPDATAPIKIADPQIPREGAEPKGKTGALS
jgi:hypothetical protein